VSDVYGTEQALEEIESELSQTFTWQGTDYPCIIGQRAETKALELDGFALGADLTLVVRLAALPATPATQQTVIVNGRTLRIETVTHAPDSKFVVLALVDPNRGA
jgi:hypothetical protein